MVRFSRRGDHVTAFERALVEARALTDTQSLWTSIARRIGLDALVAVFDELGGASTYLPTREYFFRDLFLRQRNADICHRYRAGEGVEALSREYDISARMVQYIVRKAPEDISRERMVEHAHD